MTSVVDDIDTSINFERVHYYLIAPSSTFHLPSYTISSGKLLTAIHFLSDILFLSHLTQFRPLEVHYGIISLPRYLPPRTCR